MKIRIGLLLATLISTGALAQERQQLSVSPRGATIDINFTVTPTTGYCPYTATATWSASGASVCVKSGVWTGQANATGSESIEINSTSATLTLTCSSNTDYRDLSWTNPTTNTDNSPAQLTGNKVYHGPSSAEIETTTPIVVTPARTTFRVSGLPSGARYFGIKATGQGSVDSLMSNLVSVTVSLPVAAKTNSVGCTTPPPPKPPTGVTTSSTVWEYVIRGQNSDPVPGRDVGRIAIGTLCIGPEAIIVEPGAEYWAVPRSQVTLYRKPKSSTLIGVCETQPTEFETEVG